MSISAEHIATGRGSLLPASIEAGLKSWLLRAAGLVLLLAVAACWTSLLSWSPTDPALTHRDEAGAHNLLGVGGAFGADLSIQSLGLGAALLLFAPTFWGVELLMGGRIRRPILRLLLWPLSALMLTTALATLPTPALWPLDNGYGGLLGDLFAGAAAMPFGGLGEGLTPVLTFLWTATTGVAGLLTALDCPDIVIGRHARWWQAKLADSARLEAWQPADAPAEIAAAPERPSRVLRRSEPRIDADERELPGLDDAPREQRIERTPHAGRPAARPQPETEEPEDTADLAATEAADSDHDDDPADNSAEMARRFAPRGKHAAPQRPPAATTGSKSRAQPSGAVPATHPAADAPSHRLPALALLQRGTAAKPGPEFTQSVQRGNARLLEDVLGDFGIKGKISAVRPGPVITVYELEAARGVKAARVVALADDIARSMSAISARVAVIPGRNAIGIELPNLRRETVHLREILETDSYRRTTAALPLALGRSTGGEAVVVDLARMPHLLVAGTTGSGKSVGINAMILSLLYRHTPEQCRLILIDPKVLELSVYNGIPHLLTPVVTDPRKAVAALAWAVKEMEERYKRMSKLNVRSIETYNNALANSRRQGRPLSRTVQTGFDRATGDAIYESERLDLEPMPYIVIVIDEMADLMLTAGKEIEASVQRLAQMARAAGIHLVTATQRPSVDVVTGVIKANLPSRISFKVASKIDSRTILGDQGAEQLLGTGDMLYSPGGGQAIRVHGPYVAEEEVEKVVADLARQGPAEFAPGLAAELDRVDAEQAAEDDGDDDEDADLFDRAVAIVINDGKVSTSYLQRRLQIGYNRAANVIEKMEARGIISPANATGRRQILLRTE